MALADILIEHFMCPNHSEVFINCSQSPPKETPYAELMTLVCNVDEWELGEQAAEGQTLKATGGGIPQ